MMNVTVDSPTFTSEGQASMLAAPQKSADGESYTLTNEDREKSRWLFGLLAKAKAWKNACGFSEAAENWDFWNSRQWAKQRAASLHMAVVNQIYSVVETFVGHVSDNIPDQIVRPRRQQHIPTSQVVTKLVKWADDVNDFHAEIELPTRSAVVTGFGVWRIDWDVTRDGYRGEPSYTFVDEGNFFASPWTKRPDLKDAEYCLEARNVPINYVRQTWERGKCVAPGVWDGTLTSLQVSQKDGRSHFSDYAAFTTTDGAYTQVTTGMSVAQKNKDLVTLIEAWVRQEDGTIRYVVCANGVILEDGPSPYEDQERMPYVVFNAIRRKDTVYGRSLVAVLKPLQKIINDFMSYLLDQQKYESDSPLVVDVENLEEAGNITNAAGSLYVNVSQRGPGYSLLTKPGANMKGLEIVETAIRYIRDISGNVDILRGEHPAGVTTLGAMEILRDEANVLVQKMMKQIMRAVKAKTELVIWRLKQFMTDERSVRITKPGNRTEFMTVNQRVGMTPDGNWELENEIPDDFEADVDFSPQPPGGTQAKVERAMALINTMAEDGKPLVDRQWVLEYLDEDQDMVDALMKRLEEQKAQDAQMAAAQAGAAGGGAPVGAMPPTGNDMLDDQGLEQRFLDLMAGSV